MPFLKREDDRVLQLVNDLVQTGDISPGHLQRSKADPQRLLEISSKVKIPQETKKRISYPHGQRIDKVRRDVHLVFCELDALYADPFQHLFSLGRQGPQLRYFIQYKNG